MDSGQFSADQQKQFDFSGPSFTLGTGIFDGKPISGATVKVPLKTLNRHGLVAGATGTGKTKTVQVLAEGLSKAGVPVLLMDLKGDLSGLAAQGTENTHITHRQTLIGEPYAPQPFPVELLTLTSEDHGVPLRATVTEFGPILLGKTLELNATQQGVLAVLFKYFDDHGLPLIDLKDLKKGLQYLSNEGKKEFEEHYGRISSASVGAIQRKIIALEQQGANEFFGEPSFEVDDLMRVDQKGEAFISVVRLTEIQDKPALFSSFMLSLLVELYDNLPEQGDSEKPKLTIFIDEAHLMFREASKALIDQLEIVVKLIRSKGVGVFFCTQVPSDVPDQILGQLGLRIQHAMRAVTAKDRKAIRLVAQNFPDSPYYDLETMLTTLGIGEALFTCLNEKGIPTASVATYLNAPKSRMGTLTTQELDQLVETSEIYGQYKDPVDRESAYEMLIKKIDGAEESEESPKTEAPKDQSARPKKEKSMMETLSNNTFVRQLGRTVVREISRGLLGALGLRNRR
ncbi:helicase HerA-like domain-containing protein [Persicobacter psychrovividus]|uniref:ATPase n=1 Tax=Persicobacter psychrovividus TaxID=387638 RepID=A0ABN6LF54_9BACT|nr:ATPase [Persicobacter psychrovividus]